MIDITLSEPLNQVSTKLVVKPRRQSRIYTSLQEYNEKGKQKKNNDIYHNGEKNQKAKKPEINNNNNHYLENSIVIGNFLSSLFQVFHHHINN